MNIKLLLVDDDIDDIESLTDIILEISPAIKISVAKNGNEMIRLLESEQQLPDFIFLDLNMPLKTGFECLTEIRSSDKWKNIKIVILTTSSHREQINEVYKMGADLYIRKPNSYSAFKDILSKCLQMDWGFEKNVNAFENKDNPINFFDSRLVYNDIVENIALGIVVINFFQDGSFFTSYTNKEFHKIAPTYSNKIHNQNNNHLFETTHPDDLAIVQSAVRQLFELKEFDIEFRMVDAGKTKNIRSQGKPVYNKSGNCITAYIYINDITEQVKNQESLKVSEEKYKFMFENAPHPMIMWKFGTLNISDANKKATELYGYTKEEFTKLNIRQIRPAEDIPLIEAATKNLESYGVEHKKIWRHLKKSGELMYVEVSAHVFELNGKLVSINHNQDVTEKIKAEEELKLMDFAFKKSATPIMLLLATGEFYSFNDALLNLLGYTKEEFSKLNLLNVATTMDEASCIKQWDEIREKKNVVFECHFERKDGILLDVEVSSNMINYNENEVNFCYINNITEKKKGALEKERLLMELRENNLELKQFSYITTHNLRAPLTNLILICKLLNLQKIEDPSTLKLLECFKTSTYQLNETLNDLIQVLIVKENPDLALEELPVEEILEKVKKSISETLSNSKAIIETDFSDIPTIHFTRVYLESIFLNLITNSIKYRHPERNPIVKIKTIKDAIGRTQLTFSDNGIGMDMARVQHKIFGFQQRFHKSAESKGIGLFLIKSQINAWGGQIEVDSEVNTGTTFTITFK